MVGERLNDKSVLPMKGGMWLQITIIALDSAETKPDLIK
jgi:hypothetical protein